VGGGPLSDIARRDVFPVSLMAEKRFVTREIRTRRNTGDYGNARQKRKSSNAQKSSSTVRLTRAALNKILLTGTLIER
jgi:hypothetical protein